MHYISKKTSLIILAITSMMSSRAMFWAFQDPEGPNLLIVTVMAAIVYALSLAAYFFAFSSKGLKRLLLTIGLQAIIVSVIFFFLS
jgi:hypothetical protein